MIKSIFDFYTLINERAQIAMTDIQQPLSGLESLATTRQTSTALESRRQLIPIVLLKALIDQGKASGQPLKIEVADQA